MFTVIIPTYNRAHSISQSINSVLNQTYKEFELIVVDDYSTDNTIEYLKNSIDDYRIKVIKNKNEKGAQGARNTGFFEAKHDWICFLDSDDRWKSDFLESCYEVINYYIEVNTGFLYYGRIVYTNNETIYSLIILNDNSDEKVFFKTNHIGGFSCCCFRRSAINDIGCLDEKFQSRQDVDTYYRVIKKGYSSFAVNKFSVCIKSQSTDSITSNNNKRYYGYDRFFEKHVNDLNLSDRVHVGGRAFTFAFKARIISGIFKYFRYYLIRNFIP